MQFLNSSNIEAAGYDSERRELHLRFLESGETYVYYDVEEWVFQELIQAPSPGSYLHHYIRDKYQYSRL